MPLSKRLTAEFVGTLWLVLGGCGSAVLAGAFPNFGIGFVGVSFAFGLTVLTMAFAIGHVSGCHLNPAVSVGLTVGGRFPASDLVPYIVAQVLGAIAVRRFSTSSRPARRTPISATSPPTVTMSIRRGDTACWRRWSARW
jgi:glycerol uptake facilitator-like aquaporin